MKMSYSTVIPSSRQAQKGMSLMELMIGMLLGLIVTAGAIAIYLATARSYTQVEQMAQLTENTRFVEQLMSNALRHVGFMGEIKASAITLHSSVGAMDGAANCASDTRAAPLRFDNSFFAVVANEGSTTPDIGCIDDAYGDSEVLIVKSAVPFPISDGPRSGESDVAEHNNGELDYPYAPVAGKLYVLTNLANGTLFDSDAASKPSIQSGGDYPDGTAWEYRYEVYYIRDPNDANDPRLSRITMRQNGGGAMELITQDLIHGVEDMRLRLGVDRSGDGEVDTYATVAQAELANDWGSIVSIEMALLVSSEEEDVNFKDDKTYNLVGYEVEVPDARKGFRRLVTQTSVSLRNVKFLIRGNL